MNSRISIASTALAFAAATSLHAQVQTIKKLPPTTGSVATLNLPAPTKEGEIRPMPETLDPKIAAATGLPDLVVREIRHEGDGKFGIRVANQGSLRAGTFALLLELTGATSTQRTIVDVPALDGNGEYWVTAELSEPSRLSKMQAMADAGYVKSTMKVDPATGLPVAGGALTWSIVPSKIRESNETNNLLSVDVPPT